MKIIFMRHGESIANLINEFSNTGWKHGLTDLGIQQAFENARVVNKNYKNIKMIYTSPLKRAVETANIIGLFNNLDLQIEPRIIEYSVGIQEGTSDRAHWDEYLRVWDEWLLKENFNERIEGGENLLEVVERVKNLLDEIVEKYPNPNDEVLCIGHGGTWKCALPVIAEAPSLNSVQPYWIEHTDIIEFEWQPDRGYRCIKFGELM